MPSQCRLSMHDWWHMVALKLLITQRMLTVNALLLALFSAEPAVPRWLCDATQPLSLRWKFPPFEDSSTAVGRSNMIITQALKFGTGLYYYY